MSSIKKIPVQEFLENRRAEIAAHQAEFKRLGNPSWYIIVDPEDEIICDSCNSDILTEKNPETVYVDEQSNQALCQDCYAERESA